MKIADIKFELQTTANKIEFLVAKAKDYAYDLIDTKEKQIILECLDEIKKELEE